MFGKLRCAQFCLLLDTRGRFFGLLASGAQVVCGDRQLLYMLVALRHGFFRKLRSETACELFEFGGEPEWQLVFQCFGGGGISGARVLFRFLLDALDGARSFIHHLGTGGGEFLLPLFERETMLGGNGLRSGFARRGLDLLLGVGEQARYLPGKL